MDLRLYVQFMRKFFLNILIILVSFTFLTPSNSEEKKLLNTEINITVEGADTFFPAWEKQEWAENSRINSIENGIEYSFVEYLRD